MNNKNKTENRYMADQSLDPDDIVVALSDQEDER